MVRKRFVAPVSTLQLRGFVMVDLIFIVVSYLMYLGLMCTHGFSFDACIASFILSQESRDSVR